MSEATVPPKERRPVLFQRWEDLLFFHWEYPVDRIQSTLPDGLRVDTHERRAFLSIVAFTMRGLRPRGLPALGPISNFLELNLRTYVVDTLGRPGVWFYSLDADSLLSVEIARRFIHLPYEHARLQKLRLADELTYASRAWRDPSHAGLEYRVVANPDIDGLAAQPGTLEYFWVERYRLFAHDTKRKRLYVGHIAHAPYCLHAAEPKVVDTRLMELNGFELPENTRERVLFSRGVDVSVYGFERV